MRGTNTSAHRRGHSTFFIVHTPAPNPLLVGMLQLRTRVPANTAISYDANSNMWRDQKGERVTAGNAPALLPMHLFSGGLNYRECGLVNGAPLIPEDDLTTFRGPVRFSWEPQQNSAPLGSWTRFVLQTNPEELAKHKQRCQRRIRAALSGPSRTQAAKLMNYNVCGNGHVLPAAPAPPGPLFRLRAVCGLHDVRELCLQTCCSKAIAMPLPRMPDTEDSSYWYMDNIYDLIPREAEWNLDLEAHLHSDMSTLTHRGSCEHVWNQHRDLRSIVAPLLQTRGLASILADYLGRALYTSLVRPLSNHTCREHPSFLDKIDRLRLRNNYAVTLFDVLPCERAIGLIEEYTEERLYQRLPSFTDAPDIRSLWVAHYHGVLTPFLLRHSAFVAGLSELAELLPQKAKQAYGTLLRPNYQGARDEHAGMHSERREAWVLLHDITFENPTSIFKMINELVKDSVFEQWPYLLQEVLLRALDWSCVTRTKPYEPHNAPNERRPPVPETEAHAWLHRTTMIGEVGQIRWHAVSFRQESACAIGGTSLWLAALTVPADDFGMCSPGCFSDRFNAIRSWVNATGQVRRLASKRTFTPRDYGSYDPDETEPDE